MGELVFLKLGGSLITDKARPQRARPRVIRRAAREIGEALSERPGELRLVLGHGSGSFGHYPAQKYGVQEGLRGQSDWWGLAETSALAARLNRLVADTFLEEGLPILSLQPSASALCRAGELIHLEVKPIREALAQGLVPLLYGDVAFDQERGTTIISTEEIFAYLATRMEPQRIIMVGQVEGVYDREPQSPRARLLERISPLDLAQLEEALSGSPEVDVTGGMLTKVKVMVRLVEAHSSLQVRFISGRRKGALKRALLDPEAPGGTLLTA
jgi:isopentenyl phosphate kinase